MSEQRLFIQVEVVNFWLDLCQNEIKFRFFNLYNLEVEALIAQSSRLTEQLKRILPFVVLFISTEHLVQRLDNFKALQRWNFTFIVEEVLQDINVPFPDSVIL